MNIFHVNSIDIKPEKATRCICDKLQILWLTTETIRKRWNKQQGYMKAEEGYRPKHHIRELVHK